MGRSLEKRARLFRDGRRGLVGVLLGWLPGGSDALQGGKADAFKAGERLRALSCHSDDRALVGGDFAEAGHDHHDLHDHRGDKKQRVEPNQ